MEDHWGYEYNQIFSEDVVSLSKEEATKYRDSRILEFIKKVIPDDNLSPENKDIIIENLKLCMEAGASPTDIFEQLFKPWEDEWEKEMLANRPILQSLIKQYKRIRKAIMSNTPHLFCSGRERKAVESGISVIDGMFDNAEKSYARIQSDYKNRTTRAIKSSSAEAIFEIYKRLYRTGRFSDTEMFMIIADLITAYTGKPFEHTNVKQQIWLIKKRFSKMNSSCHSKNLPDK